MAEAPTYPWGVRGSESAGAGVGGPTAAQPVPGAAEPCKFNNTTFGDLPPLALAVYTLTNCVDAEDVDYTTEALTPGISGHVGDVLKFEETADVCYTVGVYENPAPDPAPEPPEVPPPVDPPDPPPDPPPPAPPDPPSVPQTTYNCLRKVHTGYANVTFEDRTFVCDDNFLVVLQGQYLGQVNNITFNRCSFINASDGSAYADCSGVFMQYATNVTFNDCLFMHNGWYGSIRYYRNHNIYIDNCVGVQFNRCRIQEASAQGLKIRTCSQVSVTDCIFEGNLIDIGLDGRSLCRDITVTRAQFLNTGGYQNPPSGGSAIAWSVAVGWGENVTLTDCVWDGPAQPSNAVGVLLESHPSTNVKLVRPDFREWTATKWTNRIGSQFSVIGEVT